MSEDIGIIPMCDIHHDDVAQAICFNHKKLLCLSCILEKTKSAECSFTENRKVSGEENSLLLERLSVRQIVTKKKRLIEEHENKTRSIKDELKQEVIEMHGNLSKRLDEMKETCLKTVEKHAKSVTAANEYSKQKLATFEGTVNEYIAKLSSESFDDIIEIKLEEMKEEIIKNIPDKDTLPEGVFFKPNDRLCEVILRSGTSLGSVYLADSDGNDRIDYSNSTHGGFSKPICTSSDEVVYDTEEQNPDSVEQGRTTESVDSLKEKPEKQSESIEGIKGIDISEKSDTMSEDGKSKKRKRKNIQLVFYG